MSAQYEKAVARLGRQVYQAYSRGLLEDYTAIEMCKEISETFSEARELREDLEEELERDALDGLNVEEARKADEVRTLNQAQVTKRKVKLKVTKFLGRQSINRSLAAHRDRVRMLSRDLGLRALNCYPDETLLSVRGHKALCRLAEKLNNDADEKWQDIVAQNKVSGSGLSFHTILINFVANFANFSKGTYVGKFLLRWFKYNEDEEQEKLSKQYEGSNTEDALKAQMEEIEEPHLDVGREIDNMQQEYEETPEEWNLAGDDSEFEPSPDSPVIGTAVAAAAPAPEPVVEKWEPQADTWNPDNTVDEDFLGAVADAPDFPAAEPEPAAPAPAPQVLRKRPEPEAEDWLNEGEGTSSAMASPPTPTLPQVGMSSPLDAPTAAPPQMSPPAPAPAPKTEEKDDWGWGDDSKSDGAWGDSPQQPVTSASASASDAFSTNDPFAPSDAPANLAPTDPFATEPAQGAFTENTSDVFASDASAAFPSEDPFADTPDPFESPVPHAEPNPGGVMSKPAGKRPPFVKSQQTEKPLGDWATAPAKANDGWGTNDDEDYGWGTSAPATSTPAASSQAPVAPEVQEPTPLPDPEPIDNIKQLPIETGGADDIRNLDLSLPIPSTAKDEGDPLLTLLKNRGPQADASPVSDDLGDNLLPDFLKDRTDEEQSAEDSSFIPELPSFLENDEGPKLEIVPFGTPSADGDKSEESADDIFIPEMPDP